MRHLKQSEQLREWALGVAGVLVAAVAVPAAFASPVPAAAQDEISPEAAPSISQVQPTQAAAGEELTVRIGGQSFSRGAYVSFSNPAVRVVSTKRVNPSELEVKLAVGRIAQPGPVRLYVSNPAGAVAETPFTITEAKPAPSPPDQPEPGTPEVTSVTPSRVAPGSHVTVKVTGKNFVSGAKVAFSNPSIRVSETTVSKPTELATTIDVAKDAPAGKTSLFVVNPGDLEVEATFEVAGQTPSSGEGTGGQVQRFEVFNLGDAASILQSVNKPKGILIVGSRKIRYEEDGKEVFSAGPLDVKEIDANVFFRVNTGTFHVMLNSGKSFNFAPTSLRPADSQSLINTLRQALH